MNFSVPDVLGLYEEEAKRILEQHGFIVTSVDITRPVKGGQPEGDCRVIRQRTSGQEVKLILSFQKWVCSRKEV